MKILSIGNSFSQDAHRYIHRLAKKEGVEIKTVNLYIGGCSLERHYNNLINNVSEYGFEYNGDKTGIKVSIEQAIDSDEWDIITLQQVSHLSVDYKTYQPFLNELVKYVRGKCPRAKLYIHQTWAYEKDSQPMLDLKEIASPDEMLALACDSYLKAVKEIRADGIIPCGRAMMKALELGIERIHRDGFHATLGAGRYLLALCWLKALTGMDISKNKLNDFDEKISRRERKIVIEAVNSVF